MADETPSPTAATDAERAGAAPEERAELARPELTEAPAESRTKGMLREAIQKVMEEIAYHEREAQRHRRQAEELRRDLRDSLAFLQPRGQKEKPVPPAESADSAGSPEPTPARKKEAGVLRRLRAGRRKRASRRAKEE